MTPNEYQKKAHETASYSKPVVYEDIGGGNVRTNQLDWSYPVAGLSEEAGEVSGKFAKAIREEGGYISTERALAIKKELGDVCWFIAEIATCLGFTLEDVMQTNLDKLASRKARGVINGSGDNR